jgi:MerR family transcriptional regulator, redox-sensitive transcriptional activator SoxR
MTIGELARRAGVAPSAVRYYERVGLLCSPGRKNGRRVYGPDALPRLAVILQARRLGFSIADTRRLVSMFPPGAPSARWKTLAEAKIGELDGAIARATTTKAMLEVISRCRCESWEECGNALLDRFSGEPPGGQRS